MGSSLRRFLFGGSTPGGMYPESIQRAKAGDPLQPQSWEFEGSRRLESIVGVPMCFGGGALSYRLAAVAACETLAQVYKKLLAGPWTSSRARAGSSSGPSSSGDRYAREVQVVDRQMKHYSIKPITMDLTAIARARVRIDCALAAEGDSLEAFA